MLNWFAQLDRILRGEATRLASLRTGTIDVPARTLSVAIVLLGALTGACMGVYSVTARWGTDTALQGWQQLIASALKVPLLFFLTLLVTFPSLYVFNALVGSRLTIVSLWRLLIATLGVMLAVDASFGTIVVFFSLSTSSYPFMKLLNVVVFSIAGLLGLGFLLQTLHRITLATDLTAPPPPAPRHPQPTEGADPATVTPLPRHAAAQPLDPTLPSARAFDPGALDKLDDRPMTQHVRTVFRIWVVVFALVGAQMAWVLRPFIGSPDAPFSFLRPRSSNFFQAVLDALRHLFS